MRISRTAATRAPVERGIVMKRSVMAAAVLTVGTVLGVLTPVAGSTAAWADGPRYVTSTMTFDTVFPAGTICDFDFHNVVTITDSTAIFPDRTIDQVVTQATDTNLATGFTLTDTDHSTVITAADGQMTFVGIFFHLRDASGKLVAVNAGQLVLSPTGDILKFTPKINPDDAAVLCPALGGHPAT
jgi:hypothetical protein